MTRSPAIHKPGDQAERRLEISDPARQWVAAAATAAAVGVAYFLAARLSLYLLREPDGVAVFWPANGVAAGALIALGRGSRWAVSIGAATASIVANILGDRSFVAAAIFALSNVGEAVLVAAIIERRFGTRFSLDRLHNVLGLLLTAVFASAISGLGGALGYRLFHSPSASSLIAWQHWVASDSLGIATVAPLLIGVAASVRVPPSPKEFTEGAGALAAITVMSAISILLPSASWATVLPITLFPVLLWISARCQPVFAAAAAFVVALAIVSATTFEIGYFGDPGLPINNRIEGAQASILTTTLCTLVLAALFAERRQHEAALKETAARLEQALSAGAVMAFEWYTRTRASFDHSESAAKIIGYDPKASFTVTKFRKLIHSADFARYKATLRSVRPDKPSYAVTFRVTRPDGREIWLEETAMAEFDATGQCVRIKGLTVDITQRKRTDEHQRLLIAELDHRVKNVLARVATVAEYTRQSSSTIDEFIQALDGRIQSMAVAHELLSQSGWQAIRLADIVRSQLAPYATDTNTMTGGPDITLSATAAEALAMVLQELVTNASKYGALSIPGGRVSVRWECRRGDAGEGLMIVWGETGGPTVSVPTEYGYGTSLIRELIPHELGGKVDLAFSSGGLSCTIEIPIKEVSSNLMKDHFIEPSA